MADKELRKMNRAELIEIIYALQQNARTLEDENDALKKQLDDKLLRIEKAGSIAEAALGLNKIFEDAQKAADMYLLSIKSAGHPMHRSLESQDEDAAKIIEDAKAEAAAIIEEANAVAEKTARQKAAFIKKANQILRENPELAEKMKLKKRKQEVTSSGEASSTADTNHS